MATRRYQVTRPVRRVGAIQVHLTPPRGGRMRRIRLSISVAEMVPLPSSKVLNVSTYSGEQGQPHVHFGPHRASIHTHFVHHQIASFALAFLWLDDRG